MARPRNPTPVEVPRPSLPGRLEEFRTALDEEIKAAQRDNSNVVLLTGGRFVAALGGEYHYEFETSVPVRVPPDTPGELLIDGRDKPMSVTVVTIEELKVTLASLENLGRLIPAAKLKTNLTMLLRRLIERIEQKASSTWPVAERMMEGGPVSGMPAALGERTRLQPEQQEAVQSVLGRNLTFIWGPPGTGKTTTIGSIGLELFVRSQTLLLVSHTNVAVDEALHKIADLAAGRFQEGEIIRIGEPVKSELAGREDLICHRIAARRSEELKRRIESLQSERGTGMVDLRELERLIAVVEWAGEAESDLEDFRTRRLQLDGLKTQSVDVSEELAQLKSDRSAWETQRREVSEAQRSIDRRMRIVRERAGFEERLKRVEFDLTKLGRRFAEGLEHLVQSRAAEPHRQRRATLPTAQNLAKALQDARGTESSRAVVVAEMEKSLFHAQAVLARAESMGKIRRLWHGLPDPAAQKLVVAAIETDVHSSRLALQSASASVASIEQQSEEASQLDMLLSGFSTVRSLVEQERIYHGLNVEREALEGQLTMCRSQLGEADRAILQCDQALNAFWQKYRCNPEELTERIEARSERAQSLTDELEELRRQIARTSKELETEMSALLAILRDIRLTEAYSGSVDQTLTAIEAAFSQADGIAREHPLEETVARREQLSVHLVELREEIAAIEDQLTRVERDIILDARVIATTLTRAFMRDVLQERTFDTVLCDEASMAPIPALWAAATLAQRAVVIVGDFLQLPPIVQSEHAMALRWLGRDIFEASGILAAYERKKLPPFFVGLRRQFRMHPAISAGPNALIYDGNLIDGEGMELPGKDQKLLEWYHPEWGFDRPLLLLNTAEFGGWNNKAGNSRLNFRSAELCVRVASACLRKDRPTWNSEGGRRIFIIAPYRPQAALINLLLQFEDLAGEAQASTAHSCQGGEAELVILDLVVDQPHVRANLMSGACDKDIRRLLNVAMTRAKRRLIIIGNFSWFTNKGRGAFVGGELLPYLLRQHESIDATVATQSLSRGTKAIHLDETSITPAFAATVAAAKRALTLYSPTIHDDRLSALRPVLEAAVKRGVSVIIIHRPISEQEYRGHEDGAKVEAAITEHRALGIIFIPKASMHEKLMLVDERVVWTAAHSLLARSAKFASAEVHGDLNSARPLRLHEDVADWLGLEHLWTAVHDHQLNCPVCGSEMWMAETAPTSENPFYWRCAKKECYARGLREPGVVNGLIRFKCGGSPVFDYWGDDPIWSCDCGNRHRTKLKPVHLCLPKMYALVPARRRPRLLRELGITEDDLLRQSEFKI